jgi:hypothetical protein
VGARALASDDGRMPRSVPRRLLTDAAVPAFVGDRPSEPTNGERRHDARCLMRYLADSSALWRLLGDSDVRAGWTHVISDHAIGPCQPQRSEFRRSARNLDEYEQMTSMFADLYPDVPVPKSAWQRVESAQYRLLRAGAHQALSCASTPTLRR